MEAEPDQQFSWSPDPATGITTRFIEANGQRLELAECGSGDRLALCLHGFPELNFSWRYQMPLLAKKGWRVWAFNMRGYGASSKPKGWRNYRLEILIEDVAALIDASGAKEVMLLSHDWGAIIAWHFAIRKLRPLSRLVIMNVPHPRILQRELKRWEQMKRSWYAFFFQLPWFPERMMLANKGRGTKAAIHEMARDKSRFGREELQVYADAAMRPGAMTAMINYYRALFRLPDYRNIGDARVDVPTLMIWGEEDDALNINCTVGTEAYVPNLTLHRLPGVSHWVQQEAPEKVNAILEAWHN